MQFNDTTTYDGAIQKCEDWLFGGDYGTISNNPTLLKKFTNHLNSGLDKTKAIIYKADGRWQDDDPNFTDIPEAVTNLSNGIAEYALDGDMLIVEGFEVMNANGDYQKLYPIDYSDIRYEGYSLTEFYKDDGIPVYYDLKGNVVRLFPAPATGDVTMAEGLKIIYKRESDYFVSTDTTKEMGIPRTYHDVPVLFACDEYAKQNSMKDKARELDAEIIKRSGEIKDHIARRQKDEQGRITSEQINSI